ncbi:MAG: lipopolysaccharide kinase InaA family protein [Candidatus Binatia bacterium]
MRFLSGLECAGEFTFIPPSKELSGWIRKDLPEDLLTDFIRDPDRFLDDPSSQIFKNESKIQVIKRTLKGRGGATRDVVIKRFHYSSVIRRLGFFFFSSPAVRCLKGALVLKSDGIDTALPVVALEYRSWGRIGTSYYVADEIVNSESLLAFCRDVLPTLSRGKGVEKKRQILKEVASLFHKLHSRGIYHQDLKGSNILIGGDSGGERQYFLVDVGGVWKSRRLPWSKRVKNLAQLCRTLGRWMNIRDTLFFLKQYSDYCSLSKDDRKGLTRKVLVDSKNWKIRSPRNR